METNIHHTCKCIGRDFTFTEWCAYTKEHQNCGSEPVFEEFGFKWNIHDICLNPHRINILPRHNKDGYARLEISTANTRDGWSIGISYSGIEQDESSGGGCGVAYDRPNDEHYPSENDAIIAALRRIRKKKNLRKEYASLIDLEIAMRQHPQLTLF